MSGLLDVLCGILMSDGLENHFCVCGNCGPEGGQYEILFLLGKENIDRMLWRGSPGGDVVAVRRGVWGGGQKESAAAELAVCRRADAAAVPE